MTQTGHTSNSPSFEESLEQLEAIVAQLEEGQLGLNQSLEKYEKGIALLKSCYASLREAEKKIELLVSIDEDGNAIVRPFDHQASSMDQTASRAERRGYQGKDADPADVDDNATLF